jgi:hypothetical protein
VGRSFHHATTQALAERRAANRHLKVDGRPVAFHYYLVLEGRCTSTASPSTRPMDAAGLDQYAGRDRDRRRRRRDQGRVLGGAERYKLELADHLEPSTKASDSPVRSRERPRSPAGWAESARASSLGGRTHSAASTSRAGARAPPAWASRVNPAATGFYALKAAGTRARSAVWPRADDGRPADVAGLEDPLLPSRTCR